MRLGIVPCRENENLERTVLRFAWFPVVLSSKMKIWLEFYYSHEIVTEGSGWDDHANHGYGQSYKNGTFSWIVKERFKKKK